MLNLPKIVPLNLQLVQVLLIHDQLSLPLQVSFVLDQCRDLGLIQAAWLWRV